MIGFNQSRQYADGSCSLCMGNWWKQSGKTAADGLLICGLCWADQSAPKCFKCKEINYSTPKDGVVTCMDCRDTICASCKGPFHQITGHMLKSKGGYNLIRVCGICAGKFFAWRLKKMGWKPKHEWGTARYARRMKRSCRAQTGANEGAP